MNRFLVVGLLSLAAASTAFAAPPKKVKKAKAPKVPVAMSVPDATPEQLSAAELVNYGDYQCEFNQSVKVALNPKYPGYSDVSFGTKKWTMRPILSSTGAVRLEDVKGQTLMLQIAHKSMIMDVKAGRRIADECQHESQAAAKRAYELKQTEDAASAPS